MTTTTCTPSGPTQSNVSNATVTIPDDLSSTAGSCDPDVPCKWTASSDILIAATDPSAVTWALTTESGAKGMPGATSTVSSSGTQVALLLPLSLACDWFLIQKVAFRDSSGAEVGTATLTFECCKETQPTG